MTARIAGSAEGRPRGSIRTRLVVWNSIILACILIAFGLLVRTVVVRAIMATVDQQLIHRLEGPGPGPGPGPGEGPGDGPGRGGGPFGGRMRGSDGGQHHPVDEPNGGGGGPDRPNGPPQDQPSGQVPGPPRLPDQYRPRQFDVDGHPLIPREHSAALSPAGIQKARSGQNFFETTTVDDEPLRILSHPMVRDGRVERIAQAAYPMADFNSAFTGLNTALLILSPLALVVAAFGGSAVTNQVLRRVRQSTDAASQIGTIDRAARLPVSGNDEFTELAVTFNALLDRLDLAFEEQARLVEQQRRFTADASHELRTPLTVIKGTTSLFLSSQAPALERAQITEIDEAANSMQKLVNDLLTLARSDSGLLGQNQITISLEELAQQAISMMPRDRRGDIQLTIEPDDLTIQANPGELTRVLANLLDNALRYSRPDSNLGGRVTLSASSLDTGVEVTVEDDGPGVPPSELDKLGQRFYRADAARGHDSGGFGLGLSICASIVAAHGGELRFENRPDGGLRVTVRVPV